MVVFDSAVLTLLLWDGSSAPVDPNTGRPVERCKDRIELLVKNLAQWDEIILIPTPVIAEVLVVTGNEGLRYVSILQKSRVFRIEGFDARAAIELAEMTRTALAAGDKFSGIDAPWQKLKIDRQIVAIARVAGARRLYTNDKNLRSVAERAGLGVVGVHELELPAEDPQSDLIEMLEQQAAAMEAPQDGPEDLPTEEDSDEDES